METYPLMALTMTQTSDQRLVADKHLQVKMRKMEMFPMKMVNSYSY